jgi:hypothetical chaperone protein
MKLHVGLDFGTSNSGVALFDGQEVRLLPVDPISPVPEVVQTTLYITRDDRHFIGQEAIQLYYQQNVNRLRRFVKKWAGEIDVRGADMHYVRDVFVLVDELKPGRLLQFLKSTLRQSGRSRRYAGTQVFDRYYHTVDLLQAYLSQLKLRAEEQLGEAIFGVTIGRPVKFSDDPLIDQQAEETLRQAAEAAGFQEVHCEYEPVAAALFYERTLDHPENILIFDFGGGTLDIAILRLGQPGQRKVFAHGGLGIAGSDFDRTIIEKRLLHHFGAGRVGSQPDLVELIYAIPDWSALPEMSTPQTRHRLEKAIQSGLAPARLQSLLALIYNDLAFSFYNQVEMAKIALSSRGAAVIALQDAGIDLWELYTRYQFEQDIQGYLGMVAAVIQETVSASGLQPEQIDAVVKTGGSSNIPLFTALLARLFGPEKVKQSNTFSSVTSGLAIRAYEHQSGRSSAVF